MVVRRTQYNHISIFGCPATFLVVPSARTTKISKAAYFVEKNTQVLPTVIGCFVRHFPENGRGVRPSNGIGFDHCRKTRPSKSHRFNHFVQESAQFFLISQKVCLFFLDFTKSRGFEDFEETACNISTWWCRAHHPCIEYWVTSSMHIMQLPFILYKFFTIILKFESLYRSKF